jgi:hypothetical protein
MAQKPSTLRQVVAKPCGWGRPGDDDPEGA